MYQWILSCRDLVVVILVLVKLHNTFMTLAAFSSKHKSYTMEVHIAFTEGRYDRYAVALSMCMQSYVDDHSGIGTSQSESMAARISLIKGMAGAQSLAPLAGL